MKFTKPRATLPETLEFANAVRRAGGGNPIDALMPAIPTDSNQCLIAKNLNFNCKVDCEVTFRGEERWAMRVEDKATRDKIANALGLAKVNTTDLFSKRALYVILPREIGQVASDFDDYDDQIRAVEEQLDGYEPSVEIDPDFIREFMPYVQNAEAEARDIGILNDEGELIL